MTIDNLTELSHALSAQDVIKRGVQSKVEEMLSAYSGKLIEDFTRYIEDQLRTLAKEAAQSVCANLESSITAMDGMTRYRLLFEVLDITKDKSSQK